MRNKKFIMRGTDIRPRVSVSRSIKHISLQAIDDINQRTLCSISSCQRDVREHLKQKTGNKKAAAYVGKLFGEKLKQQNLNKIIFDRNGLLYHGNVQVLADSIRETGIEF